MLLQGVLIKQYTNLQKETLDSALSGCQTLHCRKLHKGNNINFTKCEVLEPRFAHDSAIKYYGHGWKTVHASRPLDDHHVWSKNEIHTDLLTWFFLKENNGSFMVADPFFS